MLRFPAHLERVEVIVELETVACVCGACQPVRVGEDVSEGLDVTPAKFCVMIIRPPIWLGVYRALGGFSIVRSPTKFCR